MDRGRRLRIKRLGAAVNTGIGLVLIFILASACSILPLPVDKEATSTAEAILVAEKLAQTMTVEQRETEAVQTEQARVVTAAAREAQEQTATVAARQTAAAQATERAGATATAAALATATTQAAGLAQLAEQYAQQGLLPSAAGSYYRLEDYSQNLAARSGMVVRRTGYSPQSFILRANVSYEVFNDKSNWFITGCGFAYWDNGKDDYYSLLVALDGNIYARVFSNGRQYNLDRRYFYVLQRPAGTYPVTLVVNPKNSYLFINNALMKKTGLIEKAKTEGALSYLLASGNDKDFGTRCSFTNVELWVVE